MSFCQRKLGKVTVQYYDSKLNKQVMLPRALCRRLDGLPDDEVDAWVSRWSNLQSAICNLQSK